MTTATSTEAATPDPHPTPDGPPAPQRVVVYTPDQHLGFGREVWAQVFANLGDSRELIWRLFRRNMIARYRQSVLGYVWAVATSVLTVLTFTYLNRSNLLAIDATGLPYPLFVLLGMTVWQFFADGIAKSAQSLITSWSLVTKIQFAKESLIFASLGEALVDFLIRGVLVVLMFAGYRVVPAWTVVFIPLLLIPVLLLTAGVGLMVSMANGVFRDIGSFLPLLTTFGIFLAPIVYPPPSDWPKSLVNVLNPVSPFIIAMRDLAVGGRLTHPGGLAIGCLTAVAVFLVGLRVFHLGIPRIVERV